MRVISIAAVMLVVVAGCGESAATAGDLAAEWYEALRDGDDAAMVETLATDAVFVFAGMPEEPFFGSPLIEAQTAGFLEFEDFDGDGAITLVDSMRAQFAFDSLLHSDVRLDCTDLEPSSAECAVTVDLWATGRSLGWTDVFTIADGKLTRIHQPSAAWGKGNLREARKHYQQWVRASQPASFDEMFGSPESDVPGFEVNEVFPYMDRECMEMHEATIDDYYASLEG